MTPNWVNIALGIGAVLGIIGALVRWVIRPVLRTAVTMEAATPVLAQIARDFRPDGEGTLKQQLTAINKHLDRQDERLAKIEGKLPS